MLNGAFVGLHAKTYNALRTGINGMPPLMPNLTVMPRPVSLANPFFAPPFYWLNSLKSAASSGIIWLNLVVSVNVVPALMDLLAWPHGSMMVSISVPPTPHPCTQLEILTSTVSLQCRACSLQPSCDADSLPLLLARA